MGHIAAPFSAVYSFQSLLAGKGTRLQQTTITDLHVWRVGPEAHAVIVSVTGEVTASAERIRVRLKPVHEISHLTVEFRAA